MRVKRSRILTIKTSQRFSQQSRQQKMKKYITFLIVILLSGCALNGSPPSSTIDTTPVITVGESKNVPADHIVFIPANTPFPIKFTVQGTVFNKDVTSTVMASFKQDMYLYRYWASLDGKKMG